MSNLHTQPRAQPAVSAGKRAAAYAAIVAGGLGILLSLILLFGAWYARNVVDAVSGQLAASVDGGLARADEQLGRAAARVEQTSQRLQQLQADAGQLGSGPAARAAAEQLGAAIDREIGPPVGAVREAYSGVRERVTAAVELLGALGRLPLIDVPELPTTELQALDTRLVEINDDVQSMRQSLDEQGLPLGTLGERIGQRLGSLDTRVGGLGTAVDGLRVRVERVRQAVARVQSSVMRVANWSAVAVTLLLLWTGLLHLLLLLRGRAWLRGE